MMGIRGLDLCFISFKSIWCLFLSVWWLHFITQGIELLKGGILNEFLLPSNSVFYRF